MDDSTTPQPDRPSSYLEKEIAAVYEEYSQELLNYATCWTRNQQDAQDAVQEVFLRYFMERTYGRDIHNTRGWLYQVLRNLLRDRGRTAAAAQEMPPQNLERVPDDHPNPEIELYHNQLAAAVGAIVTDRELACLRMRWEGLRYTEIAQELRITAGTVGTLLNRAHRKLAPPGVPLVRAGERISMAEATDYLFSLGGIQKFILI